MHMKIQIYSLVLTFVLLLIPHTGTVNTKLPITLEAANAQLKGNGPTISEHENGKIVEYSCDLEEEGITIFQFSASAEYSNIHLPTSSVLVFPADNRYPVNKTGCLQSIVIVADVFSGTLYKVL